MFFMPNWCNTSLMESTSRRRDGCPIWVMTAVSPMATTESSTNRQSGWLDKGGKDNVGMCFRNSARYLSCCWRDRSRETSSDDAPFGEWCETNASRKESGISLAIAIVWTSLREMGWHLCKAEEVDRRRWSILWGWLSTSLPGNWGDFLVPNGQIHDCLTYFPPFNNCFLKELLDTWGDNV